MTEILTAEKIGMDRISPSALDCYEQCPKLFYYRNWLGIDLDNYTLHMDFGTAIHYALEHLYLIYDNHFGGAWEAEKFEDVENAFKEKWKLRNVDEETFKTYMETATGKKSGFKSREDLYRAFYRDGIKMLKSYWKEKERLLSEYDYDFDETELYLKVKMTNPENKDDSLPIPLSMRLDALNRNKTKMVDFKTSGSKYDPVESRKKIQGQCYLFGYWMQFKKLITKFDYVVLRKNLKTDDRIEIVELEYDRADMVAFYFRVKGILQKIQNREFDAPMVGHPPYCQCRKYEEALNIEGIELLKLKNKNE